MQQTGFARKALVILIHGMIGWVFCGAIIGIGRLFFSMQTTLIIHAIGDPLVFAAISRVYFHRFAFTKPLTTAALFLTIVFALDFFLVAPVFEKSYAMFTSILGTWVPFALIFSATYITGRLVRMSLK